MGGESSKHDSPRSAPTPVLAPAPAPALALAPLLAKPWREIKWGDKQGALEKVKGYKPHVEGQQIRILLHGAVGAGKSSFINSVQSVIRGRMCSAALVDNASGDCFTKKYTTFKIPKEKPDTFYPFVFNDIMGLKKDAGVLPDDIKLAFKGHVKDDYRFNPESILSENEQFYNKYPTVNDKVHVLVCVIPADTLSQMPDEIKKKIRNIRLDASQLGIPQVAILTKVDVTCPEVNKDLRNIYRSRNMKAKMEQFSADVGIPVNCIFPVKNYHEENDFKDDVDSLILNALINIINFGDDFINMKQNNNYS